MDDAQKNLILNNHQFAAQGSKDRARKMVGMARSARQAGDPARAARHLKSASIETGIAARMDNNLRKYR